MEGTEMTIRRITYIRSMVLGGALLALGCWNACHSAAAEAEEPNCAQVGGGIVTNFLDTTDTLGTATGDLSGGLGVSVLSVTPGSGGGPTIYHVHHHWVTTTGDTLLFNDADLSAFPTGVSGAVLAKYVKGIDLIGGTGRYANATGNLAVFGAVDLNQGQLTLRYSGTICFGGE
jgi:hypothetical protein